MSLPVLCFVRNPWDWYVSWYHYRIQRLSSPKRGGLFRTAFGDGTSSFSEAVRSACTGDFDHADTRLVSAVSELDVDLYTARLTMIGSGWNDGRLTVGRFEHLIEDLEGFLARCDAPFPDGFHASLRSLPLVRMSVHDGYRDYYDHELRDLVGSRASLIVERFGHVF
jgi:hypothetical protein